MIDSHTLGAAVYRNRIAKRLTARPKRPSAGAVVFAKLRYAREIMMNRTSLQTTFLEYNFLAQFQIWVVRSCASDMPIVSFPLLLSPDARWFWQVAILSPSPGLFISPATDRVAVDVLQGIAPVVEHLLSTVVIGPAVADA